MALHAENIDVKPPSISSEAAAAKLEAGVPLLRGESLIIERQALDLVLQSAEYEDVELKAEEEQGEVSTVAEQALPESTEPQG